MAHHLDNPAALGHPPGTDIDRESNNIMHFDCQNRVLTTSITEIGVYAANEIDDFRIHDFGGEAPNALVCPISSG